MRAAAAGGSNTTDSSTVMATTSPSPTSIGSGTVHGGWVWVSEGMTRTLNARRFNGARLRTSVSACLQKEQDEAEE
jgi:hypothetical protein